MILANRWRSGRRIMGQRHESKRACGILGEYFSLAIAGGVFIKVYAQLGLFLMNFVKARSLHCN